MSNSSNNSGGGKSIFKNSIYKMVLNVFNLFVPLLVTPYIATLFNRDEGTRMAFGAYNDANGVMSVFLVFAVFGVYNFGVREIAKVRDDKKAVARVFSNLFCFSMITSIGTSLVYMVFALLGVSGQFRPTYLIMLLQLSGNILSIEWMNEAVENYGFITKKTIVVRLFYIASIFLFVRTPDDIVPYGLVMSLSVVVNNLVSFVYIKKNIPFDFSDIKLSRYIKPLFAILLIGNVNILYTTLDKVLLGRFVGEISVTEYSLPANVMNMVGTMLISLLMVAIPRLSYYVSRGEKNEYMALLNKSTRGFFLVLCPACIGLCCLAYEAMYLYTNKTYAYVSPVMQIFALRFLINSLYSIFANQILYIWGKERSMVKILAIGGGLNVLFDFMLIIMGSFTPASAVFSTAIAEIIMLSIMYRFIRKDVKIEFKLFSFKNMKYLYFSLPFFVITYFVKRLALGVLLNCIIIILICGILYVALLLISRDEMFFYLLQKVKNKVKRT